MTSSYVLLIYVYLKLHTDKNTTQPPILACRRLMRSFFVYRVWCKTMCAFCGSRVNVNDGETVDMCLPEMPFIRGGSAAIANVVNTFICCGILLNANKTIQTFVRWCDYYMVI